MSAPVLVVSGPSRVGKTTVAGLLGTHFARSVHVPVDDVKGFGDDGARLAG